VDVLVLVLRLLLQLLLLVVAAVDAKSFGSRFSVAGVIWTIMKSGVALLFEFEAGADLLVFV
jgi:hypothetical protein